MASAALAATLVPAFTPFDGDVVVALATGAGGDLGPLDLARVGHAGATALTAAILAAVRPV